MKRIAMVLSAALAFGLVSCKSGVTLQKLTKQEEEAREELKEVQAELIKLADMKEQYSVDSKKAALKDMKKRLDEIDNELTKLKAVANSDNSAVKASAKDGIAALEAEDKRLRAEITKLEAQPKENWATSVETINLSIKQLEEEVNKIMANVKQ
jgi:chromosome segregation ATPase